MTLNKLSQSQKDRRCVFSHLGFPGLMWLCTILCAYTRVPRKREQNCQGRTWRTSERQRDDGMLNSAHTCESSKVIHPRFKKNLPGEVGFNLIGPYSHIFPSTEKHLLCSRPSVSLRGCEDKAQIYLGRLYSCNRENQKSR